MAPQPRILPDTQAQSVDMPLMLNVPLVHHLLIRAGHKLAKS